MSAYEASAGKAKEPGRLPPKLLRLFALYENLTRFVMPLCSAIPSRPHPETPISQSNNIVDISRVGLKQFWNLKGHMQDASQLATAHYPETLDRIFIIGAPSFFPTVWSWIKRWFDPITVSKIFILGQSEVQSTLARYMEPADIPKKYGGELDWEWGSLPALEPTIERALTWPEGEPHSFPTGPIKWRLSADGKLLEAVAVGSQDGKPREKVIASVPAFEVPSGVTLSARASIDAVVPPIAKPTSASDAELATGVAAVSLADGPASNSDTRAGTSETRFTQQSHTLADGQLAQHTPESRDNGQGDKTTTMEPSTVGQAAKDVDVPLAQPPTEETDTSYLGQAKAAVGAAAGAATGVGASVLAAAGLGGSTETKKKDGDDTQVETKEDSRVDDMKQQEVENFIRTKYETSNQPGIKAAKE
ncbi:hypothetical protein FH972_022570 [Carpinus fangiana]|uniref:CRAL-TRIO domain-containing protein n=1 Tax=Carpinus fangiana TaxID=176857 RepID=A0A5N6KT61_9ROSI|nr:hypothetical protein FH972_022570 [Carpinus fangiana]